MKKWLFIFPNPKLFVGIFLGEKTPSPIPS
jgi:hypothetical protein